MANVDSDSDPLSYWKLADAAATEDEFIKSSAHPENVTLPELMVLKRKLIGLPAKAVYSYLFAVFIIIFTGAIGLKRCTGPQEHRSSAS